MRFEYFQYDTLPKSSWLAHLRMGVDIIAVYHGTSVEEQDGFFVEGAWDGDFASGDFDESISVLGSGGKINRDQTILFAAPSHVYERLYALRIKDELFVSNSLVFLLTQSGEELDKDYPHYASTLYRTYGMTQSVKSIPTKAKNHIQLFYYTNIVIGPTLEIAEVSKKEAGKPIDFKSYQHFLELSVANIFKNANDSKRTLTYNRPITAISKGYDSTATAVIAAKIGCKRAVTFREARPIKYERYHGGDDNGREIAEFLGMQCEEVERLDYLKQERAFPEAEIFVTAHLLDMSALSYENSLCERSILFTGCRGDIMWNIDLDENQDSGGPGMAEFRLRMGFIHFPLPYLGTSNCQPSKCDLTRSVLSISNAREMTPWSIGGDYDRPIPRRIVEEAGIERGSFGQIKKAVGVWYRKEGAQNILQADSYQDFQDFRLRVDGAEVNQGIHWGLMRTKDRYQI